MDSSPRVKDVTQRLTKEEYEFIKYIRNMDRLSVASVYALLANPFHKTFTREKVKEFAEVFKQAVI